MEPGFLIAEPIPGDLLPFSKENQRVNLTVDKGFWIAATEVTQAQWRAIMGERDKPSMFTGDNLPVEQISWHEAVAFCNRLSDLSGRRVSLPTTTQWEYAARNASASIDWTRADQPWLSDYAWIQRNSSRTTHPVATKTAQAWGVSDMQGNVWEWTASLQERASEGTTKGAVSPKEIRGGSFKSPAVECFPSFRKTLAPHDRRDDVGFRFIVQK
jgi:formylglycine-generating enzyme required for sulfatase activity